ncbi:MAG: HlyD family efflux transporter periplasmic adaptor subunit [Bryobacteraceae bacterium]|nr:HlyD family efflux transporter periplasmic adaptor subunit [Bryobacteraceae bacterium]
MALNGHSRLEPAGVTAAAAAAHGYLPAMALVGSAHSARTLAMLLSILLVVFSVALIFTPWQQSVSGAGKVSALTPVERTQYLAAPVEGRVLKWHVTEGSKVKGGQLVVELTDNDPQILERIRAERAAVEERRLNAEGRVRAHEDRLGRLDESRINAISAAQNRVQMANDRITQAVQGLTAAEARLEAARFNLLRQRDLVKIGTTSQRNVELAQMDHATAEAEVARAKAALNAARNEREALDDDLKKVMADAAAAIEGERATLNAARAEIANVKAELQRIDTRLARQQTLTITAPRDGTIVRLLAQPNSELLKSGEPVAMFVPDAYEPTVELYLNGVDMPLVQAGDPVRLQFNGWPAIQFVGWPSVAVGTFGGRVSLVDATETNGGSFRILVVPDPNDDPWPSANYLRQGVQAKGWVLLKTVPLGWELWRRFNGFPPVIADDEPGAAKARDRGKKDK